MVYLSDAVTGRRPSRLFDACPPSAPNAPHESAHRVAAWRGRVLARFLLLPLLVIAVWLTACRKKELTPAETRAITRELVFAAKKVTGGKAEMGMRPEKLPLEKPQVSRRSARAQDERSFDHIYISLPSGRSSARDAAALEKELDRVASGHGLVRENRPGAAGLARFDYWLGKVASGRRTHAIHIITPLAIRRPDARRPGARAPSARLAIIMDDLGYDRAAADALFALPFPLTLSILPHLPYSADIAEEAHRRGYQVMLHLPMESSHGDAMRQALELRRGVRTAEATRLLAGMLETVPHAAGVNNHQGSLATADAQLMAALMPALRARQLFFIDSRTTPATVAVDVALLAGVPAASRKIFLDPAPNPGGGAASREAIQQQLALAVRHAREQGSAIAIGHPHPATLLALQESLSQLEARGITLVFASELVR